MNRFFGRTLLSSLVVSSLVAFAGVAHAEGGAGGEAGAAGAAAGAGGAAAGAGGAAAGAGGAAAGSGGAAAGAAGSGGAATTCVGVTEADLKPLTACADATSGAAAFFCTSGACTPKGESCKDIYEACKADAGCEKAVYCGGLCAAGEDSVSNCAKFAGAGIGLALKVKDCQAEAAKAVGERSACGTAGSGGAAGSAAGGSSAGGSSAAGTGGSSAAGAAGAGTGGSGTAGSASTPAAAPAEEDDGCGCSVPGASHSSQAAGLVGLGLLALGLRRRKNAKLFATRAKRAQGRASRDEGALPTVGGAPFARVRPI